MKPNELGFDLGQQWGGYGELCVDGCWCAGARWRRPRGDCGARGDPRGGGARTDHLKTKHSIKNFIPEN